MDCLLYSVIECIGDQGVADTDLIQTREHLVKILKVFQIQIMPGIETYTASDGLFGSFDKRSDRFLRV